MLATHVDRKNQRRLIDRLEFMRKFFKKHKNRHVFYKDSIDGFNFIIKREKEYLRKMRKYIDYPNTHS